MAKYLKRIEPGYAAEYTMSTTDDYLRVAEAITTYKYYLQMGTVTSGGVGKVLLFGPAAMRHVEDLIDVLRYEHPLGEHPSVNALSTFHARYVGEAHHALRELGRDRG